MHDVFLSLAQSPQKLKLSGNLKAYLAACAVNRARNSNQAGQRRQTMTLGQTEPAAPDASAPGRWIIHNEELERLNNAMAQLPYPQREVILLHVQGGFEIPNLGISMDDAVLFKLATTAPAQDNQDDQRSLSGKGTILVLVRTRVFPQS